jgi:RNA polymerase sigma-70 factor, ECF subfamily
MADEPDRRLLERFVQGDQSAFESLFRQFQRDVHAWILRITRDPASADDAFVEAFWRAYRSRARFDTSRSFGAWMRRIATNAAIDQLHASRVRRAVPLEVRRGGSSDPPWHDPPSHDVSDSIRAAFHTLPPRLAVVARLALIEERPYAEIAEALDVPIGTVKSRVFRATRMLREELARLGVTS